MIFSDLIFVFAFLPIYLAFSFSCREGWSKNLLSAAASLLFIVWGRQWYYALIIVPVFLIYLSGLLAECKKSRLFAALGGFSAAAYTVFAAALLGADISLQSALFTVGVILFSLRAIFYLKEVCGGEPAERDLLALTAYLISFENMLIAPLAEYSAVKERLRSRRLVLSKLSDGLSTFIFGFARVAVFGLAFDRVRIAAVSAEAFPWLNAAVLFITVFCEVYVVAAGVLEMSRGLGLMSGCSPSVQISAFIPRARLSDHIYELWGTLPKFLVKLSSGNPLLILAVSGVITGGFIGIKAYVGAFFGIILMAIIIEHICPSKSRLADAVFSGAVLSAAFVTLTAGSAGGWVRLFSAFEVSRYDFDISYILNEQLSYSLPLMILGAVTVSPLYRAAAVWFKQKRAENSGLYGVFRIAQTVLGAVLLVIGVMASL